MKKIIFPALVILFAAAGCDPYQQGLELTRQGKYEQAAKFYIKLTEQRPNDPRAWHELAFVYTKLDMLDQAALTYDKAIALNPNSFDTNANLGYVHLLRQKPTTAEPFLIKALELKPDCETCLVNMAWVDLHLGRFDDARGRLARAAQLAGAPNKYDEILKQIERDIALKAESNKMVQEKKAKLEAAQKAKLEAGAPTAPGPSPEGAAGPADAATATATAPGGLHHP